MSNVCIRTECDCGLSFSRDNSELLTKEMEETLRQWCLNHQGHTCKNITEVFFDVESADALRADIDMLLVLNDIESVADVLHETAEKVRQS
jgi:hypothetical protein